MTAQPLPPVIPGSSRSDSREGKAGAGRPMPLASPPDRPGVVYGFGRIDASGRVADRVTIAALGWRGGDRLTGTAAPRAAGAGGAHELRGLPENRGGGSAGASGAAGPAPGRPGRRPAEPKAGPH